jgi:hypothetical protein
MLASGVSVLFRETARIWEGEERIEKPNLVNAIVVEISSQGKMSRRKRARSQK